MLVEIAIDFLFELGTYECSMRDVSKDFDTKPICCRRKCSGECRDVFSKAEVMKLYGFAWSSSTSAQNGDYEVR